MPDLLRLVGWRLVAVGAGAFTGCVWALWAIRDWAR